MNKYIYPVIALVVSVTVSAPASAVAIYSTLGAGNTFNPPHFVSLDENTGQASSLTQTDINWAMSWTTSIDAVLSGIDIALSLGDAFSTVDENVAQVFLHSDVGGTPGAVIDTYQFSGLTSETAGGAVESATSSLNPLVTAGTTYWLSLLAGLPNNSLYSQVGWHLNDQGVTGGVARENNNGGWFSSGSNSTQGAFRISGTAIPEPSVLALMALGLVGLGVARRKIRS